MPESNENLEQKSKQKIALVGAGLVGSLLAIFLAKRGFYVDVFERRPDMRVEEISAGRSINLAISTRGIYALSKLGIDDEILGAAVPMRGRMIHTMDADLNFQPYGMNDRECINSISRATLNKALMTEAEKSGRVEIFFNQKVVALDLEENKLSLMNERKKELETRSYDRIIGTDGSASAIRHELIKLPAYSCTESELESGYKELCISPAADGSFKLEKNALHIWPRGKFMLIALPNFEGSFTVTLFLPFKGRFARNADSLKNDPSFEILDSKENVDAFFNYYFADAVPLIDELADTFMNNPTGHMLTIKTSPWHKSGNVLLLGDAAHGIVPFFGQGMNCGFEDCSIFDELLEKTCGKQNAGKNCSESDWENLFESLYAARKEHTDAIADMAVENFIEMRDRVADPDFLMQKAVEKILQKEFPGRYLSRYALVTFSNIPYKVAFDVGLVDEEILAGLCKGLNKAEDVDLKAAEALIDQKLKPLLAPYTRELAAAANI